MPRTQDRPLTRAALAAGDGLAPTPAGFAVDRPHVRLTAAAGLRPGWYEIRIGAASADRFAVRKRLELTFDAADGGQPVAREPFSWNREFAERFMLKLTRPAAGVRLDIWHAEGVVALGEFRVKRVAGPRVVARALGEKVRLTRSYNCLGPALARGAKLLRRGRFREFGVKLVNGLADGRTMRLGSVAVAELNAAWTRRHALPPGEVARVRAAIDAMPNPPPLTVLLPVDPDRLDPARVAAQSVARQLYPHWSLEICAAADRRREAGLRLLPDDTRVRLHRGDKLDGLGVAVARALADAPGRVLVLPPGVELAEDALYRVARGLAAEPGAKSIGLRVAGKLGGADADGGAVWLADPRRLADDFPDALGVADLAAWATGGEPGALAEGVAAYPIDDRPLAETSRVGQAAVVPGQALTLAADLRGLSGYDHLTFAFLQGLPSLGVELIRHPASVVRHDLVPPRLMPRDPDGPRDWPMLAVGPPFLVPRFGLDKNSAAFTMWETDTLDPVWVPLLSQAAVVIVPSAWQAEAFRRDGVRCPVEVAPLGFDPVAFHAGTAPPEICTFGTAGALTSGGFRKNAQWVIDVFREAFRGVADVRLRVKISPGSTGVETHDDPRIDVIRAALPASELAEWYRSLTAYVNGSSGEGFGLHLIEAMACGRPLVTPNYSGLTAFFSPELGYAVDYDLVPVRTEIYRGRWAELRRESVVAQLRAVHADPGRAAELGERSAARALQFTWKSAGRQLAQALVKHGILTR